MLDAGPNKYLIRVGEIRKRAETFASQRRKDRELYAVLADCLALCEDVTRGDDLEDLRGTFHSQHPDRFLKDGTDVYVVVARLTLEGKDSRNSFYRYAATLREAHKRQVCASDLEQWLLNNGGVNALFKTRELKFTTATTRTLHLNQSIKVVKGAEFSLTLKRDARGFYDVV